MKFITIPFFRAFLFAISIAETEISEASIVIAGKLIFNAMAIQPLPVPRSKICFLSVSFVMIVSTNNSVSGRGIKTDSSTRIS